MNKEFKLCLTGGGTLGHVFPAIAVAEQLPEADIFFIGQESSESAKIAVTDAGIPFFGIKSGKLRRYFSLQNFLDFFNIIQGYFQARRILKKEKPDIVFSKGGFVSVPVVFAASSLKIPCITHESDSSKGLATKLNSKRALYTCVSYKKLEELPKTVYTGNPIRKSILNRNGNEYREKLGISKEAKVVLILGGSQGAAKLNEAIVGRLQKFLDENKQVVFIHQTGKGKGNGFTHTNYYSFENINDMGNALNGANLVVSRAGAGAIAEISAAGKPMILVPLGIDASRGDQIENAKRMEEMGAALVVTDYDCLLDKILYILQEEVLMKKIADKAKKLSDDQGAVRVSSLIRKVVINGKS